MRRTVVLVAALLTGACATKPIPIPVIGTAIDLTALAGEWSGEYRATETGRTGIITFALVAGRDTATGDVLMIPNEPVPSGPEGVFTPPRRQAPQPLAIQFVRIAGHSISGAIHPYVSPDCDCLLNTTFHGMLRTEARELRISGTFVSRYAGSAQIAQHGTWWAVRTGMVAKGF